MTRPAVLDYMNPLPPPICLYATVFDALEINLLHKPPFSFY